MRILLTNDDGISAPGLKVLHGIARELTGEADIWTVAPAFEQSGVGHCISFVHPTLIQQLAERRHAAEGTPADCVLAAISDVMADGPPDLILSGVNRGNNAGENAVYSGTLGAAMEGALQGVPAIALSQFYGPANAGLDNPFEAAAGHGARAVRAILAAGLWDGGGTYRLFYNVNFPPVPAAEVRGMQVCRQGFRTRSRFAMQPADAPNGRRFLWVTGARQDERTPEGTDITANLDGHVSITPMRADLTAHDALADLEAAIR